MGLIWLCWLVYACSYVGKVNYAANINQVMAFYGVDHSTAGLAGTLFFFAYGVGQVVNGLLCKRYHLKWMVFGSLLLSGAINLAVGLSSAFLPIQILWLLNGFSISVLWPSLIRLLSESLPRRDMSRASAIMGTTVAVGTFLIYALSAVFIKINFKLSFFLPAVLFGVVSVVWLAAFPRAVARARAQEEDAEEVVAGTAVGTRTGAHGLLLPIVMLCIYGVATNLIKDGLTTWVPSILKEQYQLDASLSIILTLALPLCATFSNLFALSTHKRIPDFVWNCAALFMASGVVIACVLGGLSIESFWITLVGFAVVCFLISASNSLITGIFPLFMKGKVNSGLVAGILNGFCYLGSTVSAYGLGAVADARGWSAVFWVLLGVCGAVCVGALIYSAIKGALRRKAHSN